MSLGINKGREGLGVEPNGRVTNLPIVSLRRQFVSSNLHSMLKRHELRGHINNTTSATLEMTNMHVWGWAVLLGA